MNTNVGCFTKILYFALFLWGFAFFLDNKLLYGFLCFLILFLYINKNKKDQKRQQKETKKQEERRKEAYKKLPIWRRMGFWSEEKYIAHKKLQMAKKELELQNKEKIEFLARSYQRRQKTTFYKNNLSKIDDLINLTPVEFEKWVKKHVFEKEGWKVSETKLTGDGGIDLILTKNGEHSIAQCKRFKNTVGEPLLRDFYGTMISEGVSRGYFVTTGLFSLSALKFTEGKPIEMIDRRVLAQKYL